MTHASVFSGIGGPEVAATMLGWENLFHCEINPFGRAVLDYWYPNAKSYDDITKTDFTEWRGRVNVLTGGFPCQPFSYAGQRRGATDDRYLWPYMFKCIDQIRPDWVVAENVGGILTMVEQGQVSPMASSADLFGAADGVRGYRLREAFTLQRICDDLESHEYSVQPILIPACAVGAPHRRDRVFIVGCRIASDTDERTDRRDTRQDEGTGRAQRLQERDEVRQSDQPGEVRRESAGLMADAPDARAESMRRGWKDAIHRPRPAADTDDEGLQGRNDCDTEGHGEGSDGRTRQSCEVHGRAGESADTISEGLERQDEPRSEEGREWLHLWRDTAGHLRPTGEAIAGCGRWQNFPTVSPIHRGNDGIPFPMDGLTISAGKWRTEALKAYGNAIVPQVMYEIFRAIQSTYDRY